MLYFFIARIEHRGFTPEGLWDEWEKEADATLAAIAAGKTVACYKVAGQKRVLGVMDVESHDELDRIMMADLPLAHHIEWEMILPVRPYENFANDVKRRWKR